MRPLAGATQHQDLQVLQELIETGKVTPVIDKTFPLSEIPQAIRYLVESTQIGATGFSQRCWEYMHRVLNV
jgi:NADPH:quinone reductase-like Zn-dependent oxidoreductase